MNFRPLCICTALLFIGSSLGLRAQTPPSFPSTRLHGLVLTDAEGNSAAAFGDGLAHSTATGDSESVYVGTPSSGPDAAQASGTVYAGFGTLRTSLSATAQYATGGNNYQATGNATVQFWDQIRFDNPDLAPGSRIDVTVSLGLSETHSLAAVAASNHAGASILIGQTFQLAQGINDPQVSPLFTLTNSDSATYDSLNGLAAGDPAMLYDSITYHFQNEVLYSFTGLMDTSIVANAGMTPGGSYASAMLDASHTGLVGFDILTPGTTYTTTSGVSYVQDAATSAIPEPSTTALVAGLGALGLILWRRRSA